MSEPDRMERDVEPAAAEPGHDWHLIRIPTLAILARRQGFPPNRIDHGGMRRWCEDRCPEGWREEPTTALGTVYLFEDRADAVAFALRWFPFKCG